MQSKARSLYDNQKYEAAIELYDVLIQREADDYEHYVMKGRSLEALRKYEEAFFCYDKALSLNPCFATYYDKATLLSWYLKRYEEAIELYDKCLESDPSDRDVLMNKAGAYRDWGKIDQAIETFERALYFEEDAEEAMQQVYSIKEAYVMGGNTSLEERRWSDAIECFQKCQSITLNDGRYRVAPDNYYQYYNEDEYDPYGEFRAKFSLLNEKAQVGLGHAYYEQGNLKEAGRQYPYMDSRAMDGTALLRSAECYLAEKEMYPAYLCLKEAAKYGVPVEEKLNMLQREYPEHLVSVKRNSEKTLKAVVAEAEKWARKCGVTDKETIQANIQLLGMSIGNHYVKKSFEELYSYRVVDNDDVIGVLSLFGYAAVMLSDQGVPPLYYQRWVKKQIAAAQPHLHSINGVSLAQAEAEEAEAMVKSGDYLTEASAAALLQRLQKRKFTTQAADKHIEKVKAALRKFEEKSRTVEGILYSSMEEAAAASAELSIIKPMMEQADLSSEDQVKHVLKQMEEHRFQTPAVSSYVKQMENVLAKFEEKRSFRGVIFSSEEQARLAAEEWEAAQELYEQFDLSTKEGAEASLKLLEEQPFQTGLPQEHIDQVKAALNKFDLEARTIDGIIYDTLDEAEAAELEIQKIESLIQRSNYSTAEKAEQLLAKLESFNPQTTRKYVKEIRKVIEQEARTYEGKVYGSRREAENAKISKLLKKAHSHQERRNTGFFMKTFLYLLGIGVSIALISFLNIIGIILVALGYMGHFVNLKEEKKAWKELTDKGKKALPPLR
ncbi:MULTISPECIES: tetratricopeptide repeat protein [unclassified Paenibacillus]|uniref:tetratricopeptide repeat protein n=1 Tax=unclassified Paenibacillus TaxID=185978 RepID=UPI001AE199B2|nr:MULTISPECIES: tetratricopeptide repeat protein [unclassified Paenibacillus]MBP1154501.1 Flp pilus assembly protein TadD [Paenibacillus sp. PvP091]MBP1170115.1 Flp pilus assembly protein TadD [Paenibacillus sp. PvR098]MBP2441143.1 Flp pilus assembly protein TadD [Paenibacillus sp. PvP052]